MLIFYTISLLLFLTTTADEVIVNNTNNITTCVQPQYYWLTIEKEKWSSDILTKNLCGTSWYDLMKIESVQIRDQAANFWFVIFHQLCTASLNSPRPLEINSILSLVLDNLERGCSNISKWSEQWQNDENIFSHYNQLYAFNTGELNPLYPSCSTISNNNSVSIDSFSFTNLTDLFLVVLPTNETVPAGSRFFADVVAHIFRLSSTFIGFTSASVILILAVSVMYAVYFKKMKYSFYWSEPEPYDDIDIDDNEYYSSISISDSDNSIKMDDVIIPEKEITIHTNDSVERTEENKNNII